MEPNAFPLMEKISRVFFAFGRSIGLVRLFGGTQFGLVDHKLPVYKSRVSFSFVQIVRCNLISLCSCYANVCTHTDNFSGVRAQCVIRLQLLYRCVADSHFLFFRIFILFHFTSQIENWIFCVYIWTYLICKPSIYHSILSLSWSM